jgi:tRNA dimethylallyltransferase
LEETKELIKKKTRNFAKRQMTWFRKERGIWLDTANKQKTVEEIIKKLGSGLEL